MAAIRWRPGRRKARAEAVRRLKNAEQQYAGAVNAQKEGNVALAATLYLHLAVARPRTAIAARPSRRWRRWPTKAAPK